jgi:tetratricopeptide (TPR) repeat protein
MVLVAFLGLLCNPFVSFGQDSTAVKDLSEEKELRFQQFFFKALSEKSIKNYQKAIENLEVCNELLPENVSVYFEFSKNYLLLNNVEEAKQYVNRALSKEPDNIWLLGHLVDVHKKERNYQEAIEVQKKIVAQNPKKKSDLIRLYYLNRDYKQALLLMDELEKTVGLSKNLRSLKKSLEFRKGPVAKRELEDIQSLVASFEENSSFALLKKLLDKSNQEDMSVFHKYSEKGVDLFPAQPYVYLMRGRSLQIQNKFQEALTLLQSGIDFVIDNPTLESEFYETLAKVYEGLGQSEKAQEYRNKAKKLKEIK